MFARFRNVLVAVLILVMGVAGLWMLFGNSNPFSESSSDFTPRYDGYTTFDATEVGADECIAVDDSMEHVDSMRFGSTPDGGETAFVLVEDEAEPTVVVTSGDFAGRDEHNLFCMTADQIADQKETERLELLLRKGEACIREEGGIVAYAESEFSHRDRIRTCVSDEEAQADDELAGEFIAELDRVPRDGEWTDRAQATVTLYCDLKEQWGGSFTLTENAIKVNDAFSEIYELDRSYSPGYPREFEDAVADWCGIYETDKGEPMPQPYPPHEGHGMNEDPGPGNPNPEPPRPSN